ncbi:hypothetical protein [Vibrio vulnificus]|uniref:hypothetical protein n=1 Tax=Vibrio vulnificus TaxID=672 RepID=UPI001FAF8738|nr:hypothetical protein [Vibrio vulnificus]MCJ0806774.1 hypothetical protein [Vibrio vulnificus]
MNPLNVINKKVLITCFQVLIKTLSMIFLLKLAAKSFSVDEFAHYSQFLNVNQVLVLLSGTWCTTGVVSLIVSDKFKEKEVLSTAFLTSSITSVIFLIFIFSAFVLFPSVLTITDLAYKVLMILPFSTMLNNLVLLNQSRLNACNKIGEINEILIIVSIVNFLAGVLFYFCFLNGMYLYLPFSQVVAFFIINIKFPILKFVSFRFFNLNAFKSLCKYIFMGGVTIGCVYISQIFLREYFIFKFSAEWVGFWQVSYRLSELYLMLFSSILSIFIVPVYARLNSGNELYVSAVNTFKILLPVAILGMVLQFFFRKYIILVAFDSSYLGALPFYSVQMVSDFFKILAWSFCYVFLAKGYVRKYIYLEISSCFALIIFSALYSYYDLVYSLNFAYLTQSIVYLFLSYCLLYRGKDEKCSLSNDKVS